MILPSDEAAVANRITRLHALVVVPSDPALALWARFCYRISLTLNADVVGPAAIAILIRGGNGGTESGGAMTVAAGRSWVEGKGGLVGRVGGFGADGEDGLVGAVDGCGGNGDWERSGGWGLDVGWTWSVGWLERGFRGRSDVWGSVGFFAPWEAEAHVDVVV